MTSRKCEQCGNIFNADEPWKKICLPCWKKNKEKTEDRTKGNRRRTEKDDFKKAFNRAFVPPQTIPEDMLKTLIFLCHPDRHNGKDSATKATQFLLSLRDKT